VDELSLFRFRKKIVIFVNLTYIMMLHKYSFKIKKDIRFGSLFRFLPSNESSKLDRLSKYNLIITCVILFLDMMIFLIVGTTFDLVTVVRVNKILHIFFVLSRYKWDNKLEERV